MANYLVFDNVVTPEVFTPFQEFFMSPLATWKLDMIVYDPIKGETPAVNNYQGSCSLFDDLYQHIFYPNPYGHNGMDFNCRLDLLRPVMSQLFTILNPLATIRIKANVNFHTEGKVVEGHYHQDRVDEDGKGAFDSMFNAVFYLNTCDGYTRLKDENGEPGEKIMSQANRLAIFNNKHEHCGSSTSDTFARFVVNINYVPSKNCPYHKELY